MLTRYLITIGATTTAGGRVTSGSSFLTIGNAAASLEGDTVWCPACKTEGVIGLDGPRLSDTFDGREQALDGDLCLCKCGPPPRLVASQDFSCQEIDAEGYAAACEAAARAAARHHGEPQRAGDMVPPLLLDRDTQAPSRHRPYQLELGNGRDGEPDAAIEGVTDAEGATRPLSAAERAAVLAWQRGRPDGAA